jgi:hypothetical protein
LERPTYLIVDTRISDADPINRYILSSCSL